MEAAVEQSSCPACAGAWPRTDHLIARGDVADLYLHEDQFFRGWCVLVLRRHAVELYDLTCTERHAFVDQAAAVSAALASVFQARKMNYELLGNQLPHLHWHLIPRRLGDPSPLEPVWRIPHEPRTLTGEDLEGLVRRLRLVLQ
jgi:diadenosine tetraphosphate (Ap4A) HIT family hydrolase